MRKEINHNNTTIKGLLFIHWTIWLDLGLDHLIYWIGLWIGRLIYWIKRSIKRIDKSINRSELAVFHLSIHSSTIYQFIGKFNLKDIWSIQVFGCNLFSLFCVHFNHLLQRSSQLVICLLYLRSRTHVYLVSIIHTRSSLPLTHWLTQLFKMKFLSFNLFIGM